MMQRAFVVGWFGLVLGTTALAQKPPPLPPVQSPRATLPSEKPPPLPRQSGGAPGTQAELPRDKPPPLAPGERAARRAVSSGTGFVVAARRIMTNHHVIEGCAEVAARLPDGRELPARVLASDATRDLALLSTEAEAGPILPFRSAGAYRRGEGVVTYGFPLAGLLSSGPTLTTGEVSALSGLADNPRHIQISAPVQPGNSGGPLLDMRGQVIGVVVSKLNAGQIARQTGDIPQNVNFAVKHTEALDFLREQNVAVTPGTTDQAPRAADAVGEVAHPSTLFLRCLK
ncbi:MAG: trypsin-like peptidase domain-containing protein [Roseomonas sp.]|nr:trypsin-like peptidase domain-containing protein [Roseomonas sp.]MCA3317110.1 trypsin-like peptidase domain-containing protein [Roseomonas sp.]MCA3319474.1 trypsin-like peptidase domain-containing protein [Roseomonas sp.]